MGKPLSMGHIPLQLANREEVIFFLSGEEGVLCLAFGYYVLSDLYFKFGDL